MATQPTAQDVATHLGWPIATLTPETTSALTSAITVATQAARAYTRGRGFSQGGADEDVCTVILSTAARIASNPTNARRIESGSFNAAPGMFEGWTLAELAILNRHRVRANALALRGETDRAPDAGYHPPAPDYVGLFEHGA